MINEVSQATYEVSTGVIVSETNGKMNRYTQECCSKSNKQCNSSGPKQLYSDEGSQYRIQPCDSIRSAWKTVGEVYN